MSLANNYSEAETTWEMHVLQKKTTKSWENLRRKKK